MGSLRIAVSMALLGVLAACGPADPTGVWAVESGEFTTNDCDSAGEQIPFSDILISTLGKKIYLDFQDGTPEVDCDLNGSRFTCPEIDMQVDRQRDALLTTKMATAGTVSKDELNGTRTGAIHCQGVDCGVLESMGSVSFPCALDVAFSAVRSE